MRHNVVMLRYIWNNSWNGFLLCATFHDRNLHEKKWEIKTKSDFFLVTLHFSQCNFSKQIKQMSHAKRIKIYYFEFFCFDSKQKHRTMPVLGSKQVYYSLCFFRDSKFDQKKTTYIEYTHCCVGWDLEVSKHFCHLHFYFLTWYEAVMNVMTTYWK